MMLAIFHASKEPVNGLYNWLEYREVPAATYTCLNEIIGGNIEGLPNKNKKSPFSAYVNEEMLVKNAVLGVNELGGGTLHYLGYEGQLNMSYFGNVVCVLGKGKRVEKRKAMIEEAVQTYRGDDEVPIEKKKPSTIQNPKKTKRAETDESKVSTKKRVKKEVSPKKKDISKTKVKKSKK